MPDVTRTPWGSWEDLSNEQGYHVKRLTILGKQRISLQKHFLRSEYWVVVKGTGKFTLDGEERALAVGDQAYIPRNAIHRLENIGTDALIIIETQIGTCVEEDIERLADDYGRVK